jgi:DNA-binding NtrC family response regulator
MDPPTLCIDDRRQTSEIGDATLESQGYCVKLASSGCTTIKDVTRKRSVAAVLLGFKQEGINGECVACHTKQRYPSRSGSSTANFRVRFRLLFAMGPVANSRCRMRA